MFNGQIKHLTKPTPEQRIQGRTRGVMRSSYPGVCAPPLPPLQPCRHDSADSRCAARPLFAPHPPWPRVPHRGGFAPLACHARAGPLVLVLAPTRELANQIHEQAVLFGRPLGIETA